MNRKLLRLPTARPARSLQRQQLELLGLYLASLTAVLLVFSGTVRAGFRNIALADLRSQLSLIAEDLSSLPLPDPDSARSLQESRRDFSTAHQQVEWFTRNRYRAAAQLGELHNLGPLPGKLNTHGSTWQEGPEVIALIRPVDAEGVDPDSHPRIWLRVSASLEPLEDRIHQLDLAMGAAIILALALSATSAVLLSRRVVEPLARSLRRLREFELDASHELRGPLAAMAANAEMGLLDCGDTDSAQQRRYSAIANATEQMQQLVDDLLLLARQDERAVEQATSINLSALVGEQLNLYRDVLKSRQQQLRQEVEADLWISGQQSLLHQLVRNVLDNAHRHTPESSLIEVKLRRRGALACLEVSDNGPGIPKTDLPKVFDRFWRASPDRSDGGSGMGLAIAARICQAHGGGIRVTSAAAGGSSFLIDLPLQTGSAQR